MKTHFPEEGMLLCQFIGSAESDEELRSVVVGARAGTPHQSPADKLESCVELILTRGRSQGDTRHHSLTSFPTHLEGFTIYAFST